MKSLKKSTLFITALLVMQSVSARPVRARAASITKAPTAPTTPVTPPALPPRNLPSTNSFQSYLQQVRDMKSTDVINSQGMLTDKFKNFVKSSGLNSDFRNALFEAGAHLNVQFTGIDAKDKAIISMVNANINRSELPTGANYQQFMKTFKQSPILPDGSVSSDWIEGAAIALRADGLSSMDQLTDAMTNILTDFVMSSPIAKIRDGLAPTLRSFDNKWKAIQQKGIGEATQVSAGGVNYRQFMRKFNQNPLRNDGSVSPAWIEGAALALKADGLTSMNQITDAMRNIVANAVRTSPIGVIRNNESFTMQTFNDELKKLQQKGIGEATQVSAGGVNYRQFMRKFNQNPLRNDGSVSPAWIEGAALALKADGLTSMNQIADSMRNIVANAVRTSPIGVIRNNESFTMQTFNDELKKLQQKGFGEATQVSAGGVNYRQFMRKFNQNPLRKDGSVSPDWIEGAALALKADGLTSMNQITDAMRNIVANAVQTSPIGVIRNNQSFTMQTFNDELKKLQQKGIGKAIDPNNPIWGSKTIEQELPTGNPIWGEQVKEETPESKQDIKSYAVVLANENYDKQIVAAFSINKRVIKLKIDTFVFLRGIAQEMRDTILLEYPNTDKDTLYKAIMGGINNVLAQNGSFASNDDLDEVETFIYDIIISQ